MNDRTIPVFAGPSIPMHLRQDDVFDWRPPATAGDLVALLDIAPARLCLVDGVFDARPAPWHKELLLLMARGTLVFGAASMGALRAAELERFGMVGIGAIFRAYRDGRLTGDDEVALIHAPARLGWAPLSVPMVEFRATLLAARRARLLTITAARAMRGIVHDIFYEERDWPTIAAACRTAGLAGAATLRQLEAMHVRLKTRDALECLAAARAPVAVRAPTVEPPATCFMDDLVRTIR